MPILTSDYTWRQTLDRVTLTLDLHHTSPKKVDVVTTTSYLKVSFLPYICEVFLCHTIKVEQSSARILKGCMELSLVKTEPQLWKELGLKLTKDEMDHKRQEAVNDVEKEEKRKADQRKKDCRNRENFAVSQQIVADDQVRAERIRVVEREKAEFFKEGNPQESDKQVSLMPHIQDTGHQPSGNDGCPGIGKPPSEKQIHDKPLTSTIENKDSQMLRGRLNSTCSEEGAETTQEADYDGDGEDSIYYSSTENLHHADGNKRHDKVELANRRQRKWSANRKVVAREKEVKKRSSAMMPAVRCVGTITTTHTPRVFPSPARESTQPQEQQWLEAQTSTPGHQETGTTSSQLNEEHFRKKAVMLFTSGDYQGCINACTEGLRLNPSSPAFYSNRAAGHLTLRNFHHTMKDCSKALELLTPPTPGNSNSRLLCYIRRGTALVHLSLLSEGLVDYQAALRLTPENKALRKDVERIQNLLMASTDSNEDSGCEAEGERGGTSFNNP